MRWIGRAVEAFYKRRIALKGCDKKKNLELSPSQKVLLNEN